MVGSPVLAMSKIDECPNELAVCIREFWPEEEWDNAAAIAELESDWNAFAIADSRRPNVPCGATVGYRDGVKITAEYSIGYFQINACNFDGWEPARFYNARHNAGTAHLLWETAGRR